jgi:hypothetical protein
MARGYYKTPEEIEAEQLLQAERYPEQVDQTNVDPTQANRDALKRLMRKAPAAQSIMEPPSDPETFEISPEIKRYGYNLFGMDQLAPSDVQIPFPVGQEPEEETQPERAPAAVEAPEVEQAPAQKIEPAAQEVQAAPAVSSSLQQSPAQQAVPKEAQMATSDVDKMIQQATEEEDRAALLKQAAKFGSAVMGAGLGRVLQTDTSLYEDLEKRAQRPMKNFLLKQELDDKKAKSDPNSEISKLTRKSLEDLGMNMQGLEGVPYAQLEKLYPSLTQALYTKIAADARKEENSIRRSERADAKLEKLDQNKQKELVKHIDYSVNNLKKAYEQYSKSQTTIDSISNIIGGAKNKITPGTADVTMLYSFISSLDPASTVREGEIALSKSAMSLWGRLKQGTAQLTGGDLLDSATRKSIEEIMKVVQAAREKQFAKQKANMIQSGVGKGLDKDMLNAYIYPEIDASSVLNKTKKEEVSVEDKLKQFEDKLNKNQTRIQELKNKREM